MQRSLTRVAEMTIPAFSALTNTRQLSSGSSEHFRLVVLGGGTGGAVVSADLGRKFGKQVAVVEPREWHSYQPGWTLVGAGFKRIEDTMRPTADVLSRDVTWVKDAGAAIDPEGGRVELASGRVLSYDFLVVATGLECRWDAVRGLRGALGDGFVTSNYSPEYAPRTWEYVRAMRSGSAIFTYPATPVKCGGAGQKAAYCAEDFWRREGRRGEIDITYVTTLPRVFHVPHYADALDALCATRGIDVATRLNLIEVRPASREAVFANLDNGNERVLHYDLLHVVPPQGPLKWLRDSPLANADGWVDVHKETLQHLRYPNVFALGDCSSLPTSKTAAAVAAQFSALRDNLLDVMAGTAPRAAYGGYTSCPVVAGRDRLMLMEFDYTLSPVETFPWDQRKVDGNTGAFAFWLKKDFLPWAYWNLMTKGRIPWREVPEALGFKKRIPLF